MTVQSNSTNVYLQVVRDQGYLDFDKLSESLLVIGSEEVFTLTYTFFSLSLFYNASFDSAYERY